jgi:hypothetical protein
MDAGDLSELRRSLADAQSALAALEHTGARPRHRPRFLGAARLLRAIDTIGRHAGPVTLIVGAGASMEADLPSWRELVTRVLRASQPGLPEELRERWVAAVLSEGIVSGAAVAQALATSPSEFRDVVLQALYRGRPSRAYVPGAISQQVAWWKHRFGRDVRIATFNYDDMLEQALEQHGPVRAAVDARAEGTRTAVVRHLHGRLHDGAQDLDFVLSDDDYARFPLHPRWQDEVMRDALEHSMCVFVGLSFTDPNLTRWIHRSAPRSGPPRIALFSRQGSPRLAPDVREELERTTARRWAAAGVDVVFTDFFGELGQVLHEAALVREGGPPAPFVTRALERHGAATSLITPTGARRFLAAQRAAASWLHDVVDGVRTIVAAAGGDLGSEQLAVGLWVADHPRGEVLLAATSDRAMTDRASLQPIPMAYISSWAAVEAITRGVVVESHPEVYATRWRYVRGLPLVADDGRAGRIAVGAVTLTSTSPSTESALNRLPPGARNDIDRLLIEQTVRVFA